MTDPATLANDDNPCRRALDTLRAVWDPPWTPDRMSTEALEALGFHRR